MCMVQVPALGTLLAHNSTALGCPPFDDFRLSGVGAGRRKRKLRSCRNN